MNKFQDGRLMKKEQEYNSLDSLSDADKFNHYELENSIFQKDSNYYTIQDQQAYKNIKTFQPSEQKSLQKQRSKSMGHINQIERLAKHRISERINDINNKILYPVLMGPHPIYTVEYSLKSNEKSKAIDLMKKLKSWINKNYIIKIDGQEKQQAYQQGQQYNDQIQNDNQSQIKSESDAQEGNKGRCGTKYNKYSLQFKKNIVRKIRDQISRQKNQSKSLRYYVVKQSKLLNIHPKNITRWVNTDLDKKQGGRKAKFPLLQYKLANFIKQNPQSRRKVILQQAKRIMKQLGEKQDQNFHFSKGWFQRFRNRLKQHKVSRSVQGIYSQLSHVHNFVSKESSQQDQANSKSIYKQAG